MLQTPPAGPSCTRAYPPKSKTTGEGIVRSPVAAIRGCPVELLLLAGRSGRRLRSTGGRVGRRLRRAGRGSAGAGARAGVRLVVELDDLGSDVGRGVRPQDRR